MEKKNLKNFIKGWIIGNFEPALAKTTDFEIAIKRYNKGDTEPRHFHKLATEWTIVIEGVIKMNNTVYIKDDIVEVNINETITFECVEDAITIVVKSPCVPDDKYIYILSK